MFGLGFNYMTRNHAVLVCPRNDEESLLIIKIAKAIGLNMVISSQGHGAKLENEENLIERIKAQDPDVRDVVIVEIPGVEVEQTLCHTGMKVHVIDHHRYDGLDRLNAKSSLEQFLDLFEIDDEELKMHGFDPMLVRAVGANDRGFLWELQKIGLSDEEQVRAVRYIGELVYELGFKSRKEEEGEAREAWDSRKEQNGFLIIESKKDDIDIRDAVSYLIFDEYKKPTPTIIKQGNHKLYVQETQKANDLIERFGGFLFGSGKCWGMVAPRDGKLVSTSELLKFLV